MRQRIYLCGDTSKNIQLEKRCQLCMYSSTRPVEHLSPSSKELGSRFR